MLAYDPETGIFRWLETTRWTKFGDIAGGVNPYGYSRIGIDRTRYLEHRLAWLMTHGEWPDTEIDHINGNRSDNRISNLRKATTPQQRHNMKKTCRNTSGVKGVYWDKKNKKWAADICSNSIRTHVGRFLRIEDAEKALNNIRVQQHGEFARHA